MLTSLVRGLILPRVTLVSRAASTSIGSYGRVVAERRVFISMGSRRAFSFTSPVYAVTRPTRATPAKTPARATRKTTGTKKTASKKPAAKGARSKTRKPAAKKKPLKKPVKKVVAKKKVKVLTAEQKLKLKQAAARKFLALPENIPPTRGSSAFIHFTTKYRTEHPQEGARVVELTKRAAAEWNKLSDEEKNSYENSAAVRAAKEEYEKWKASKTMSDRRQINQARVLLGKNRIFRSGLKEVVSGYNFYSRHIRQNNPDFGTPPAGVGRGVHIMREIGKMWSALSDAEKAKYNKAAAQLKEAEKDT